MVPQPAASNSAIAGARTNVNDDTLRTTANGQIGGQRATAVDLELVVVALRFSCAVDGVARLESSKEIWVAPRCPGQAR
jgi:hypothetical protein